MTIFQELEMYKNFDELATDLLDLAKEILPEQFIFLSSINDTQQVILKLSNDNTSIDVTEGTIVNLNDTLCQHIDFGTKQPLIYEDVSKESSLGDFKNILEKANIKSYLGIPISFVNGEKFGTLCAVNDQVSRFDEKSIHLLQRIVRMFSYYLDLERFAYRDALTNLYNRRYLAKFFEDHHDSGGTVFFLDLDGFKGVNDLYGHDAGDMVLEEVASRLQKFIDGYEDVFAVRLGGDEFVIHFSQPTSAERLSEMATRLLDSLMTWDDDFQLSASLGIATYSINSEIDLKTLLKNADFALFQAKKSGKNAYQFFETEKIV
ncbi:diguanylate cyclase domain-containing protein [Planococcus kocurii]|uniref:sensor domain-containing protein n=1 Tax=Planococcus TaxID=1372 RepID=UPI0011ECFA27|nr:sensor domain-containing diguanylate cyclase [Planococcus sp. ANT_H30]KAA0955326.1 sensor domain-containing diguanylate cyclase [Planococcus sp. ANT_H30]